MDLPIAFVEKMRQILGEEADAYFASLDRPPLHGLRINTSKWSVEEALARLPFELTPVPWTENGFVYDAARDKPSAHPYYHCGLYYLQEPSAMAPASFLPVSAGDRVLDLCAAPGGKTTQLALPLQEDGLLVSNDISASRAKALIKNIELFGLRHTVVTCESPERLAGHFPAYFDKILVDAPCSGEGMFRQGERMWRAWEEHGPDYFAPIQKEIVTAAARMLAPGGHLVYSTCTFDPREDEQVIEYLLQEDPTLRLSELPVKDGMAPGRPDLSVSGIEDLSKAARFYPHKVAGEGHFVALLSKEGGEGGKPHAKTESLITEHCLGRGKTERRVRVEVPGEIAGLSGIRFLRSGLTLGEVKSGRVIPSQAYAMTLKEGDYEPALRLALDDERVARYLKGESLPVHEEDHLDRDGEVLVLIDGFAAGWGKVQGRRIKNQLLPGWRRQF